MSAHVKRYRVVPFVEGDQRFEFCGIPTAMPLWKDMRGFPHKLLMITRVVLAARPILACTEADLVTLARTYGAIPKSMGTFHRGIALLITRGYLVPFDSEEG